jgi:hypothetical protein
MSFWYFRRIASIASRPSSESFLKWSCKELLGGHTRTDYERRFPEAPISQPLPSLVRTSGALVVHHLEHELRDEPPSSPTSSRTRRLRPFGRPPGFPLTPGVKPLPVTPPARVVSGLL